MSDKNANPAAPTGPVQTENDASRTKESGRAVFDSGGRSSWEWKTETGNFSREISTKRLKLLEAPDLTLEKTALLKKVALQEGKALPSEGFNPYDQAVRSSARPAVRQARCHATATETLHLGTATTDDRARPFAGIVCKKVASLRNQVVEDRNDLVHHFPAKFGSLPGTEDGHAELLRHLDQQFELVKALETLVDSFLLEALKILRNSRSDVDQYKEFEAIHDEVEIALRNWARNV